MVDYGYEDIPTSRYSFELAGIGTRFFALLADSILIGILTGIAFIFGGFLLGGLLGAVIGILYHGFFMTNSNGQTPGKSMLGIRVIKTDGSPITFVDATIRYLGYYLNTFALYIGWFWAFIDSRNQGFHDKIANTYVVTVKSIRLESEKSKRKNDYDDPINW